MCRTSPVVHHAKGHHATTCGRSGTEITESVTNWGLVTCQDCLAERANLRRKQIIGGGVAFSVWLLMIGICGYAARSGDDGTPEITQAEISQTIVAERVQATLQSMSQTREYPTRQAIQATQAVAAATTVPQTFYIWIPDYADPAVASKLINSYPETVRTTCAGIMGGAWTPATDPDFWAFYDICAVNAQLGFPDPTGISTAGCALASSGCKRHALRK